MNEGDGGALNCVLFLFESNWLDTEPGTKIFFNDILVGKVPEQED